MRKIPTLFRRDPDDMRHVLPEVTPGCEWVLAGEGIATRKYDGTCVMLDVHGDWWARREVKEGKPVPRGFLALATDPATGKTVGWEPIAQSSFSKVHAEAILGQTLKPGTYELVGPKINGNPESYEHHEVVLHARAQRVVVRTPSYDSLREDLTDDFPYEGIVWHHADGRMAKLKVRDFR